MATLAVSPEQLRTLQAIVDTVIAPMTAEETRAAMEVHGGRHGRSAEEVRLLCESAGSGAGVDGAVLGTLLRHAKPAEQDEMKLLLSVFGNRFGNFALTGNFSAFADMTQAQREEAFYGLSESMISLKRKAFLQLKALIARAYFASDGANPAIARNPIWPAICYEGPPLPGPDDGSADNLPADRKATYDNFEMQNETITEDTTWSGRYDVVVIGSGCGGGVVAAELAAEGHRVLVVDKGPYQPRAAYTQVEADAFDTMYEQGGVCVTQDTGIAVLAGSCFGGGSAINWACSLRTPNFVREEWANTFGLRSFIERSYEESLEAICKRINVSDYDEADTVNHNTCNQIFIDGCRNLGYDVAVAPQNMADVTTKADQANAGRCCFGDRRGNKQSTPETFLQDCQKSGVHFMDRCKVHKVLQRRGAASGFVATVAGAGGRSYTLTVEAPVVVVSAGSLNTPALLLRSGLKNGNIGKNLRLHPVCAAVGMEGGESKRGDDGDGSVKIWDGPPMTTVSNVMAMGHDGSGYGAKLECPSLHPGTAAAFMPWKGAAQFKDLMMNAHKCPVVIVLARDKGSGRVSIDANGDPVLNYPLAAHDRRSLIDGLERSLRVLEAAGVEKVLTMHQQLEMCDLDEARAGDDAAEVPAVRRRRRLDEYVATVREAGVDPSYRMPLFSAHQMGSCRMGTAASNSVVNEEGEVWEVRNLYVADASTFPSPSGANPMITTLAISHSIAQHIKRNLRERAGQLKAAL